MYLCLRDTYNIDYIYTNKRRSFLPSACIPTILLREVYSTVYALPIYLVTAFMFEPFFSGSHYSHCITREEIAARRPGY